MKTPRELPPEWPVYAGVIIGLLFCFGISVVEHFWGVVWQP